MAIKATAITYEISLAEIKDMLAKELNLSANNIDVQYEIGTEYHGDQRESWETHKVTGVKVIVKPNRTVY
jgi:hypothetical protein